MADPHRRKSFLVEVWVEVREIREAQAVVRGRVRSLDNDAGASFTSGSELTDFIIAEFRNAGFADAGWEVSS